MTIEQPKVDPQLKVLLDDIIDISRIRDDDTLERLAYADLLDDNSNGTKGDPNYDRATFIRLQIRASELPANHAERKEHEQECTELLRQYRGEWEKDLRALGATDVTWERGFPARVAISATDFLANGNALFEVAPITNAWIQSLAGAQVEALADSPLLQRLTVLSLRENAEALTSANAHRMLRSPNLVNLRELDLSLCNDMGILGIAGLSTNPYLKDLEVLDLSYCGLGENWQILDLHKESVLANLRSLNLGHNNISHLSSCISEPRVINGLQALILVDNPIGDSTVFRLVNRPASSLPELQQLNLAGTEISDVGVCDLVASERMAGLTHLILPRGLTEETLQALRTSPLSDDMHLTLDGSETLSTTPPFDGTLGEFREKHRREMLAQHTSRSPRGSGSDLPPL